MGLTIHYNWRALHATATDAERLVRRLHAHAQTLAFDGVSEVFFEHGDDRTDAFGALYPGRRTILTGREPDADRGDEHGDPAQTARDASGDEDIELAAERLVDEIEDRNRRIELGIEAAPDRGEVRRAFSAELIDATDGGLLDLHPDDAWFFWCSNAGCEPLLIGLARYPAVVEHTVKGRPDVFETGLGVGWHWEGFCKTQYAGIPRPGGHGGDDHFVRCHDAAVRLLAHARHLGLPVTVQDESGYWHHRDTARLRQALRDWNAMVARIAGRLHDGDHPTQSPIFDHPEFEHLEAEGDKAIRGLRDQLNQDGESRGHDADA